MTNATLKEVTEEEFEEKLDDIYGEIDVCGYKYSAGRVLRELDPIAFRCGLADEPEVWVCGDCETEHEEKEEAEVCCAEEVEIRKEADRIRDRIEQEKKSKENGD